MNTMNRQELAAAIYRIASIRGQFKLRSGKISDHYFDKYRFEGDPRLLRQIAEHMVPLIPRSADILAGLEMGGIPIATMLSQITGLPTCFVRKEAKAYGTCRFAEGAEVAGKRVVIVEDVVTSGGQVLFSTADLRKVNAHVEDVLCVIDREEGGPQQMETAGLRLHALFRRAELEQAAATLTNEAP